MAYDDPGPSPETVALDALIKATVAGLKGEGNHASPDAMLFMGNWHQAVPAMVIQDPILEPVDKVVWMVIMSHARKPVVEPRSRITTLSPTKPMSPLPRPYPAR